MSAPPRPDPARAADSAPDVGTPARTNARAAADDPGPASGPACHPRSGCVTCSDEGVPMRVVEAFPARALALCQASDGSRSEVMTDLVGRVSPGDRLLVHAGTALLALESGRGEGERP